MDPNNGGQPDWITQVRRLPSKHAHEEIVVNKDGDEKPVRHGGSEEDRMERGESESGSRTAVADGSRSSPVHTANDGDDEREEGAADLDGEIVSDMDLGEGDHEWREGRDLVVEHQARSSDEVCCLSRFVSRHMCFNHTDSDSVFVFPGGGPSV